MAIILYHHPMSRAATVVWMLEELGVDYELSFVDMFKGEQKKPEIVEMNPMGKLPIIDDGGVIVSEAAAIGLYLADKYAPGRLAPALDAPERATYLRWSLFAPTVIEPGLMAKAAEWKYKDGQAGWGTHEALLRSIEVALTPGPYVLGDTFSMADVIFGGTVRFMLQFGMLEKRDQFVAYGERLGQRDALKRADAKNQAIMKERNITFPS